MSAASSSAAPRPASRRLLTYWVLSSWSGIAIAALAALFWTQSHDTEALIFSAVYLLSVVTVVGIMARRSPARSSWRTPTTSSEPFAWGIPSSFKASRDGTSPDLSLVLENFFDIPEPVVRSFFKWMKCWTSTTLTGQPRAAMMQSLEAFELAVNEARHASSAPSARRESPPH